MRVVSILNAYIMDDEEQLYREMYENDGFYMGDRDEPDSDPQQPNNQQNDGCCGVIVCLAIIIFAVIRCVG